ncbi:MAG: ABC transporter ATP-binding protein/permease [Candidatus Cloacimonetes bacterium]|nr:ABC transporter ATP-binding protein/permease [Candidatus Cloacimonadota bacterium]
MSKIEEKEYKKNFDSNLWEKLIVFVKPYKREVFFLILSCMALAGIDVIFPLLSRYAIDKFVIPRNLNGLPIFASVYFGFMFVQAINIYIFIMLAGKVEMGISYNIRKKGFDHLQKLSFNYFDKTPVGWIMARMTSDCERLGSFISWGLVDMIWGTMLMTGIMIAMLILNWKLALLSLTVVPFLILISLYFQRKILKAYRRVRKINSKITGSFNEGISGAQTTKTLVREEANLKEFQEKTQEMFSSSVRSAILASIYLPIILALGSVGTGFALWFGGNAVVSQAISFGTLIAFLAYTVQFFEPLRELARVFSELQGAQASAERIFSMLEEKPQIKDTDSVITKYGDSILPKTENWDKIHGEIEFKDVNFSYIENETILENFNLKVKSGETIALVGETGSGKSTVVNLACRFYEPTSGEILIDGEDYRERSLHWLHSNLGYVLQNPHLFSGSIKENIAYGSEGKSDEEIAKAAKLVNAHNFIMKLENGYNSEVGESGNLLSVGEKQLISFARAILANPQIFVLDEATSSVDTETEKHIQNAIEKVLEHRTSFIIAHRLSTIRNADRILVIKKGKVTEQGNHRELIQQKGYYYRLYTNQFMEEKEEMLLNA